MIGRRPRQPISEPWQQSCLYVGTLTHRRVEPRREFRHRVALAYLDLDELPELVEGQLLRRFPGLARFRRRDYHGDSSVSLSEAVRDTVELETGSRPDGPVRLLSNLRSFGHCFNPVSFYYCFSRDGERLDAFMAEVTNTPWGERDTYVVPGAEGLFPKRMHVSPFMPMDHVYRTHTTLPADRVSVTIENFRLGQPAFAAALDMRRLELTSASVRAVTARFPLQTVRNVALIYTHALALRLAGVKTYPHPRRGER